MTTLETYLQRQTERPAANRAEILERDRTARMRLGLPPPDADGPPPGCGTISGYHRHRRRGETTCEWCRRAVKLDARRKRAMNRIQRGLKPDYGRRPKQNVVIEHGTESGYTKEMYWYGKSCPECRAAVYAARNQRLTVGPIRHGTPHGYQQEIVRYGAGGTCPECRAAESAASRNRRRKRKARR